MNTQNTSKNTTNGIATIIVLVLLLIIGIASQFEDCYSFCFFASLMTLVLFLYAKQNNYITKLLHGCKWL